MIGGGAAGLMAAGRAAQMGAQTILLEKMGRTGRKMGISGKGRCNLTNTAPLPEFIEHFGKNGRFLRQSFQRFFSPELISFFKKRDLPLVTERGGRIFPESGRALDVVRIFNNWLKEENVRVIKSSPVTAIIEEQGQIKGVSCNNTQLACDNVILATGGLSYPKTGSSGDGYALAKKLGHTVTPLRPALVPLLCPTKEIRRLAGLELRNITARIIIGGSRKVKAFGELFFTKTGISGPIVLTASSVVINAIDAGLKVSFLLDLKPALHEKKLDRRLIRDFGRRRDEEIKSILRGLLPRQLIPICLQQCDIPADIDPAVFPVKLRKRLVQWLKNFHIDISGYGSYNEAIITAGGVNLGEILPENMESRYVKGLFFAGELLDIQADTGGYNLQAAFSTGWAAGSSVY